MLTVVDIGARGGPHPRWFPFADSVQIVGFDADAEECARLRAMRSPVPISYLPYAIGTEDGDIGILHVTQQPGCSSLLRPNRALLSQFPYGDQFRVLHTTQVTLVSLDTVCARHQIVPDVLKIDVQGYELAVLLGATDTLRSVSVVELEVEFNPIYEGQPLFGDLDAALRSRGFSLLGLRRSAWRRTAAGPSAGGTIMHGDALYIRQPTEQNALVRFIIAMQAYGQFDYLHSLGYSPTRDVPTRSLLHRAIGALSLLLPSHRHVRAFIDASRPPGASDWHDPEFC